MRRLFRLLPIVLFAAVVLAVGVGRGLPETRTLERSVIVEAPAAEVYDRLARIRRWRGWYVGPEAGRFEGPDLGPGGTLVVDDPETGETRRLELTETSSPTRVAYRFPDVGQTPYAIEGSFRLEALGPGRTRVTSRQRLTSQVEEGAWMEAAGKKWFLSIFADRVIGSILLRELHNLKGAVEGRPPPRSRASEGSGPPRDGSASLRQ